MELVFAPEVEHTIKEQATEKGLTPEQLVLEALKLFFMFPDTISKRWHELTEGKPALDRTSVDADFLSEKINRDEDQVGLSSTTEEPNVDKPHTQHVQTSFQSEAQPTSSLYDLLKDHIGVIEYSENGQEASRLSENTGQKFTDLVVQNYEQGHL